MLLFPHMLSPKTQVWFSPTYHLELTFVSPILANWLLHLNSEFGARTLLSVLMTPSVDTITVLLKLHGNYLLLCLSL